MVLGTVWPRLLLTTGTARPGFFLLVYGCVAAWTANLLAAIWGAGGAMLPIAAGAAHGTSIQEGVIAMALKSAAVSLVAGVVLVLWGLRAVPGAQPRG